jgi:hypothetical protein
LQTRPTIARARPSLLRVRLTQQSRFLLPASWDNGSDPAPGHARPQHSGPRAAGCSQCAIARDRGGRCSACSARDDKVKKQGSVPPSPSGYASITPITGDAPPGPPALAHRRLLDSTNGPSACSTNHGSIMAAIEVQRCVYMTQLESSSHDGWTTMRQWRM